MRLIDADALKEWIENWFTMNRHYHPYSRSNNIPTTELTDIIDRMPAVDAVEVIHCGHCRHHENDSSSDSHWCFVWETFTDNHVYCNFAERRQDETY